MGTGGAARAGSNGGRGETKGEVKSPSIHPESCLGCSDGDRDQPLERQQKEDCNAIVSSPPGRAAARFLSGQKFSA